MNLQKAEFSAAYGIAAQLPESRLPEVAFAGRSNVGKSSLLNRLFNRKSLARVSSVPGKTVTINFYGCGDVYFVDLPGYGYARASRDEKKRWSSLVESYYSSERDIRLTVQLVDMRHPPSAQDMDMLSFLYENKMKYIIVLTKCDKLNKTEFKNRLEALPDELGKFAEAPLIPFSAVSGEGREQVIKEIESALTL